MHLYTPVAPLDRYIICLWHVDLRMPYPREKILPSGTVELIINFGSPFRLYDHTDPSRYTLHTDSWLVGLQTSYLLNEPLAETHMIGVRFKPAGLAAFFRNPAAEFHNQIVPVDTLWAHFTDEARSRLYQAASIPARFALLERMLLDRLRDAPRGLDAIQYAVDLLAQHGGTFSIKSLSEQLGMSHKHLATQFQRFVGVSPKALARIYRFQHALQSIDPADFLDWATIAQTALYYDQSHFNKDFATLSGLSPGDYLRLRREVFGDTLAAGQDVHFVPIN